MCKLLPVLICKQLHKLMLTSIIVFLPIDAQLRTGMAVVAVYTVLMLLKKPYVRAQDDLMHLLAQVELFLLLLAGLLVQSTDGGVAEDVDIGLSVVLIAATIAVLVVFLIHAVLYTRRYVYEQMRLRNKDIAGSDNADDASIGLPQSARAASVALPQPTLAAPDQASEQPAITSDANADEAAVAAVAAEPVSDAKPKKLKKKRSKSKIEAAEDGSAEVVEGATAEAAAPAVEMSEI